MSEVESKKPLHEMLLGSSVVAACVAGLLSTIIGGIFLEKSKRDTIEIEKLRESREELILNQLDVLEKLNQSLAEYKVAAEFVIHDIARRAEEEGRIEKSIDEYDSAAEKFLVDIHVEVFRARLYFKEPKICDELEKHLFQLEVPGNFISIDAELAYLIHEYKKLKNDQSDYIQTVERIDNIKYELRNEYEVVTTLLKQLSETVLVKQAKLVTTNSPVTTVRSNS